jgi:hypothetical protein
MPLSQTSPSVYCWLFDCDCMYWYAAKASRPPTRIMPYIPMPAVALSVLGRSPMGPKFLGAGSPSWRVVSYLFYSSYPVLGLWFRLSITGLFLLVGCCGNRLPSRSFRIREMCAAATSKRQNWEKCNWNTVPFASTARPTNPLESRAPHRCVPRPRKPRSHPGRRHRGGLPRHRYKEMSATTILLSPLNTTKRKHHTATMRR